jgi:methylenetetrahydrofolate reductase (NADPH)
MRVDEIYKKAKGRLVLSIEVLPPRNGGSIDIVFKTIDAVRDFHPAYISVTHGSGGSLRGGTAAIASLIKERYKIESLAHLTCVGATRQDVENTLIEFHYLGVENLLALRGDPPEGSRGVFQPVNDGHRYASDLVGQIQAMNRGEYQVRETDYTFGELPRDAKFREGEQSHFCIGGACYPEGHIECPDREQDIQHLKTKVDAGVDYLITQMVFTTAHYRKFLQDTKACGINVPIIPGIMPLSGFGQIGYVEKVFRPEIPESLKADLKAVKDDKDKSRDVSVEFTVQFCRELIEAGAPGLHFYTMNRGIIMRRVLKRLHEEGVLKEQYQMSLFSE